VVTVLDDASSADPADGYADVTIRLHDGRTVHERVEEPHGAPASPLTWEELAAKFRDCANGVIVPAETETALGLLAALDEQPDVRQLMASVSGVPVAVSAGRR
jgi:2-methylcitrate dehydratase PrpD